MGVREYQAHGTKKILDYKLPSPIERYTVYTSVLEIALLVVNTKFVRAVTGTHSYRYKLVTMVQVVLYWKYVNLIGSRFYS